MVRESRIKEYTFPTQNFSAASSGIAVVSDYAINGRIVSVKASFNQSGSVALYESGNSTHELWRLNASSGTNPFYIYPRRWPDTYASVNTSGTTNDTTVTGYSMGPLMLITGSCVSGTAANLNVTVRYE